LDAQLRSITEEVYSSKRKLYDKNSQYSTQVLEIHVTDEFIIKIVKGGSIKHLDRCEIEAIDPKGLKEEVKALAMMLPPLNVKYLPA